MLRPVDPDVVRKLADCIELLPNYINSPRKMPFVQKVIQKALEQSNSDRQAFAEGIDVLLLRDELNSRSHIGQKYSYKIGLGPTDAEEYREPVRVVWLLGNEQKELEVGFDVDETGIFESLERQAAYVAEWLKEMRHPREAEVFRKNFSFACREALLNSQGVEVAPGVYRLDLSTWETEVAKPLCDDLRAFADEMEIQLSTERSNLSSGANLNALSTDKHNVFVPTNLQKAILKTLEGKAMKKQELANEVCGGEGSRLYRQGGIKELREIGRVDHKPGVGYFRPDAPPAD